MISPWIQFRLDKNNLSYFISFYLFIVTRHLNYPSYQFNVLRLIIFSRKFNVYFVLSKEYALKASNKSNSQVIESFFKGIAHYSFL